MAIKKLQNNYTTPEQSKRLLGLGVPADSADCLYSEGVDIKYGEVYFEYNTEPEILPKSAITGETISFTEYKNKYTGGFVLPCWSVGRLIEIYHICDKPGCSFSFNVCFPNLISEMIYKIVEAKEHGWIDFSKLEE